MKGGFLKGVFGACVLGLGFAAPQGLHAQSLRAREPDALLVKRVSGDVRALLSAEEAEAAEAREVKVGDLPDSGTVFVTGAGAALELRFHPDFMTLHASAGARLRVDYPRGGETKGGARRVALASGRVTGDLSRQGPGLLLEDAHAEARMREGRLAFSTDSAAATVLVLEGEAEVAPRAGQGFGPARTVRRGEKAVAGAGGVTVTRAGERELAEAGLGQNRLEVDFQDPATGAFRTLEIEYERRP